MSSIQAIHDQLTNIKHVIVCVDPVDLDNIWLSPWALVRAPNAHVHITLSPRVLDLRVPTFAELFEDLVDKVGLRHMLDVLDKNVEELYDYLEDEDLRDYFARDTTFQTDPHAMAHMELYTALSALRFARTFSSKGHASSRYTLYRDPRSMETIIPGIHHPTHVNDYLYACSDKTAKNLAATYTCEGKRVRKSCRRAGYQMPKDILHTIEELIELFEKPGLGTESVILCGGPFTEMVRLFPATELAPLAIVAMACTWYADVNIFPNNYNDLMDLGGAMEIENIVQQRVIPTWFFPTERAKAKVTGSKVLRACPWDFTTGELISIFAVAGDMKSYEQAAAFTRKTKTLAKVHMFDVLTVVPLAVPQSLLYRRAVSYWDQVNRPINVFYPDEKTMAETKKMAMEEISHVLAPIYTK